MNHQELVGQVFQENQLYELLHFDIEQNFDNYLCKFIHLYFDHLEGGQVRITEIAFPKDEDALYQINRRIVGQRAWIEIYDHSGHVDLMICRLNRSGKFSVIGPHINHVQTFRRNTYDLPTQTKPLTPEEQQEAFEELCGMLESHTENSKPKKAI